MAIDSVSSISVRPLASAVTAESRVYMQGNANAAVTQAEPTSGNVSPVVLDVEGSLREAVAQISRASQAEGPMPVDVSAAAQSYMAEAEAQNQVVVQTQSSDTPPIDVFA